MVTSIGLPLLLRIEYSNEVDASEHRRNVVAKLSARIHQDSQPALQPRCHKGGLQRVGLKLAQTNLRNVFRTFLMFLYF